jgi:thymidylate kinase
MIDGIDGSGKSTIMATFADALRARGRTLFSLPDFQKQHQRLPSYEELASAEVVLSAEPSYCWFGAAIRQALIKNAGEFSGVSVAQAYALDREVGYRHCLIPALESGKVIISDRGVSTTLCYQPIQTSPVPVELIVNLTGNRLALEHRPDVLILAHCPAQTAAARLAARAGKQDNAMFERVEFLERAAERFASPAFQSLFTERGTRIITVDTSRTTEDTRAAVTELIPQLMAL